MCLACRAVEEEWGWDRLLAEPAETSQNTASSSFRAHRWPGKQPPGPPGATAAGILFVC